MLDYKNDFNDKIVVITGAASGIGKEVSKRMSDNGARVVMWDYNEKDLKILSAELGNKSIAHKVDVSDENSIKKIHTKYRLTKGINEKKYQKIIAFLRIY